MRVSELLYPESIARCQHIKVNGVQCGSPSLRNRQFCFFHHKSRQRSIQINANRARRAHFLFQLPLLEDANSIQVALMQVMRLLLANQIEHKTAALLFYALQTASSNLRNTSLEPQPQQVVIDPRGVADTNLGDEAWYKEEFEDEEEDSEEGEEDSNKTADIEAPASSLNLKACAAPTNVRTRLATRYSRRAPSTASSRCPRACDAEGCRAWSERPSVP